MNNIILNYQIKLIYLIAILGATNAAFECSKLNKNSNTKCRNELHCVYDEYFEEEKDLSKACGCKTVIKDEEFPTNILTYDVFHDICFQHEHFLRELWIVDVKLKEIDNLIFEKYQNLKDVYIIKNNLILNFTSQAKNLERLDISDNGLTEIESTYFNNLLSLKFVNISHNKLEKLNNSFKKLVNLEEIYLNNNKLQHIDKHDLNNLQNLTILNLAHNVLTSISSELFLQNLKNLYLNHNQLYSINIYEHVQLPSLKVLDISNNSFTGIGNNHYFKRLQQYFCQNNQFETLDKNIFQNLQNLKIVNCSSNKIKSIDADTFNLKARLNIVDLSINTINEVNSQVFENVFQNLVHLNLNDNSLSDRTISCDNLKHLTDLRSLELSTNKIKMIYNCTFEKLEKLQKLSLMANKLESISSGAFRTLSMLEELDLSKNNLSSFSEHLLNRLSQLKKLNLSNNNLTNFDINWLRNNTLLTSLDLKNNQIKHIDFDQLQKYLPALKNFDFDKSLIDCEKMQQIFCDFFENNIKVDSCDNNGQCCKKCSNNVSWILYGGALVIGILTLVVLGFIFHKCCVKTHSNVQVIFKSDN